MGRQADGFCKARYGIAAPPILILMKTPSPCPHQPTVHRIAPSSDRCQTVAARGGALNGFRRRVAFITCLQAVLIIPFVLARPAAGSPTRPRIIVTSDGEIDDECSLVRFLLYVNEWDVEGIITSSSQYHWQGHKWAGDDWAQPYLKAYAEVYPTLLKHDQRYPTPDFLQARTLLGNVKAEGEMEEVILATNMDGIRALRDQGLNSGTLAMCPKAGDEGRFSVYKITAGKIEPVTELMRKQ